MSDRAPARISATTFSGALRYPSITSRSRLGNSASSERESRSATRATITHNERTGVIAIGLRVAPTSALRSAVSQHRDLREQRIALTLHGLTPRPLFTAVKVRDESGSVLSIDVQTSVDHMERARAVRSAADALRALADQMDDALDHGSLSDAADSSANDPQPDAPKPVAPVTG